MFGFCLPLERPNPPVRIQRLASNRYLFSSGSTDLRAHEPALLTLDQLACLNSYGPVAGALGLMVGFGSNFLTVIRSDNRMVLHNGYHRAYTLRALGITHAPCIVETVTRTDELRVAASDTVSDAPAFYFRAARPPMLRDFFNPRLIKRLAVRPMETVVEVEFKIMNDHRLVGIAPLRSLRTGLSSDPLARNPPQPCRSGPRRALSRVAAAR